MGNEVAPWTITTSNSDFPISTYYREFGKYAIRECRWPDSADSGFVELILYKRTKSKWRPLKAIAAKSIYTDHFDEFLVSLAEKLGVTKTAPRARKAFEAAVKQWALSGEPLKVRMRTLSRNTTSATRAETEVLK